MKRFCHKLLMLVIGLVASAGYASDSKVAYPSDYRQWTHVKSMVIQEGHPLHAAFGGLHHLYANDKAMKGYQSGKFPNGSVIVFDLLEANDGGNAITEGNRKVVGVMQKHEKRFKETGGWGFEAYAAGDAQQAVIGDKAKAQCFQCHISEKDNDYVFSQWRD